MVHANTMQSKRVKSVKRGKPQRPRVTCTICMKPAVRYYIMQKQGGEMVRKITYEHRDEPPVREDMSKNGSVRRRYRRCYTGVIHNGLPFVEEREEEEEKSELDYKNKYEDTIHELSEIAVDISGEEAKRILNNLQRYLETKRHEMSK
jgi:hypothetical protein